MGAALLDEDMLAAVAETCLATAAGLKSLRESGSRNGGGMSKKGGQDARTEGCRFE